jgi:hypothetical protein
MFFKTVMALQFCDLTSRFRNLSSGAARASLGISEDFLSSEFADEASEPRAIRQTLYFTEAKRFCIVRMRRITASLVAYLLCMTNRMTLNTLLSG